MWLALSIGYFYWQGWALQQNVIAIACGYPEKLNAACVAKYRARVQTPLRWVLTNWLWVAGPTLVLASAAFLPRLRSRAAT
jgi:hypothetical protein